VFFIPRSYVTVLYVRILSRILSIDNIANRYFTDTGNISHNCTQMAQHVNFIGPRKTADDLVKGETAAASGDCVEFERPEHVLRISHFGIYGGEIPKSHNVTTHSIYHLSRPGKSNDKTTKSAQCCEGDSGGKVGCSSVKEAAGNDSAICRINNRIDRIFQPDEPNVIIERAKAEIRANNHYYNLFSWNCETFATFCRSGKGRSEQVVSWMLFICLSLYLIMVAWLLFY